MTEEKTRPDAEPEESAGAAREDEEAPETEAETGAESDDALQAARRKAEENWNEYLRACAELDNVRKRAARDVEQARRFAIERFVADLLPVRDSLEQGLDAAREEGGVEKLIEGKELTLRMLDKVLAAHGVEQVDPAGEKFDPTLHEAMTTQPSEDHEPDSVMMVVQKGYLLNGRLVRPARVVVARRPEADDGGGREGGKA